MDDTYDSYDLVLRDGVFECHVAQFLNEVAHWLLVCQLVQQRLGQLTTRLLRGHNSSHLVMDQELHVM